MEEGRGKGETGGKGGLDRGDSQLGKASPVKGPGRQGKCRKWWRGRRAAQRSADGCRCRPGTGVASTTTSYIV